MQASVNPAALAAFQATQQGVQLAAGQGMVRRLIDKPGYQGEDRRSGTGFIQPIQLQAGQWSMSINADGTDGKKLIEATLDNMKAATYKDFAVSAFTLVLSAAMIVSISRGLRHEPMRNP